MAGFINLFFKDFCSNFQFLDFPPPFFIPLAHLFSFSNSEINFDSAKESEFMAI
jgi:hypothetical protein